MKQYYNIVIPSYEPHYQYNIKFLESFDMHCLDKNDVKINIIGCNVDYKIFMKLKNIFPYLNINIFTLSQLIKFVDGIDFDDSSNNFNTKYPLQSIKKLFAYSIVDSDYIVLDSENICVNDFYFRDLIESIKSKKIKYCNNYWNPIQKEVVANCNKIINYDDNRWYFLNSYWYYEKKYVEKLIHKIRQINNEKIIYVLKDIIFFEYQLYSSFITKKKFRESISVDDILNGEEELKTNLSNSEYNYEYICSTITPNTIYNYIDFLNKNDERITRLHWMSDEFVNKIITNTKISIGTFHWD
jgi:hypothetical protein